MSSMNDDSFLASRFWQWCVEHELASRTDQALAQKALDMLVESVKTGELTCIDGIDSPLSRKIKAYHKKDEFEMNSHWIGSSQTWGCPCCERSKFQISRIGNKNQILAKLVIHHDHMREVLDAEFHAAFESAGTTVEQIDGQRLVERIGNAFAAYEEVLICEDCNNADTEAKKLVGAPRFYSFSIGQIRRFIQRGDHKPHRINASTAEAVWCEAQPAYELRMKLIRAVAHAAATDSHWYEPYARGADAIPVLGYGQQRLADSAIRKWVSVESLGRALGPQTKQTERNLSRWRTVLPKPGHPPPPNFLAMLRSDEGRASAWDSVPDHWHCPICKRSKYETVYIADQGKIGFYLRSNPGRGLWAKADTICNHCDSVLMRLKLEISSLIGSTPSNSYGFVSPEELTSIIIPRPHSPHSIRPAQAQSLVSGIVSRLSTDS